MTISPIASARESRIYLGGRVTTRAALDDRPGDRWSQSGEVALSSPPLALGLRDSIVVGLGYRYSGIQLDRESLVGDEPRRRNLHSFGPSVSLAHVLSRRWFLVFTVYGNVASDLRETPSFEDVQLGAAGMFTYLVGGQPNFRISFGLLGTYRPFLSPVFPVFAVDYRSKHVALSAGFTGLRALALLGDRAELGVFGSFGGGIYHLAPSTDPRLARVKYLRATDIGVGPAVNLRLAGPVWLEAKAGYNVLQSAKLTDDDLDPIPGSSLDSRPSFFGQIGIAVR